MDAFMETLNRFPPDLGAEGQPWIEEAFLEALDHFNDDEDEDEDENDGDEKEARS